MEKLNTVILLISFCLVGCSEKNNYGETQLARIVNETKQELNKYRNGSTTDILIGEAITKIEDKATKLREELASEYPPENEQDSSRLEIRLSIAINSIADPYLAEIKNERFNNIKIDSATVKDLIKEFK